MIRCVNRFLFTSGISLLKVAILDFEVDVDDFPT